MLCGLLADIIGLKLKEPREPLREINSTTVRENNQHKYTVVIKQQTAVQEYTMLGQTKFIVVDPMTGQWVYKWRETRENRAEIWATEQQPTVHPRKLKDSNYSEYFQKIPECPEHRVDRFLQNLTEGRENKGDLDENSTKLDEPMSRWLLKVDGKGRGSTPKWPRNLNIEQMITVFDVKFGREKLAEFERQLLLVFTVEEVPGYHRIVANGIGWKWQKFGYYRKLLTFDTHLLRIRAMVPDWPCGFELRGWQKLEDGEEAMAPSMTVKIVPYEETSEGNSVEGDMVDFLLENMDRTLKDAEQEIRIVVLTAHLGDIRATISYGLVSRYRDRANLTEGAVQDLLHALCILEVALGWYPSLKRKTHRKDAEILRAWFTKLVLETNEFSEGFVSAFWGINKMSSKSLNTMTQEDRLVQKWYQRSPELSLLGLQVHQHDMESTLCEFVTEYVLVEFEEPEEETVEWDEQKGVENWANVSSAKSVPAPERFTPIYVDSDSQEKSSDCPKIAAVEVDSFATVDSDMNLEEAEVFDEVRRAQDEELMKKEKKEAVSREIRKWFGNPKEPECAHPKNEFLVLTVGYYRKPFSMLLENSTALYLVRSLHCDQVTCGYRTNGDLWKPTEFGARGLAEPKNTEKPVLSVQFCEQSGRFIDKSMAKTVPVTEGGEPVLANPSEMMYQTIAELTEKYLPKVVELDTTVVWDDTVVWRLRCKYQETKFVKKTTFNGAENGTRQFAACMYQEGALYDRTLGQAFVSKEVRELSCKMLKLGCFGATVLNYLSEAVAIGHPLLGYQGTEDNEGWE